MAGLIIADIFFIDFAVDSAAYVATINTNRSWGLFKEQYWENKLESQVLLVTLLIEKVPSWF